MPKQVIYYQFLFPKSLEQSLKNVLFVRGFPSGLLLAGSGCAARIQTPGFHVQTVSESML